MTVLVIQLKRHRRNVCYQNFLRFSKEYFDLYAQEVKSEKENFRTSVLEMFKKHTGISGFKIVPDGPVVSAIAAAKSKECVDLFNRHSVRRQKLMAARVDVQRVNVSPCNKDTEASQSVARQSASGPSPASPSASGPSPASRSADGPSVVGRSPASPRVVGRSPASPRIFSQSQASRRVFSRSQAKAMDLGDDEESYEAMDLGDDEERDPLSNVSLDNDAMECNTPLDDNTVDDDGIGCIIPLDEEIQCDMTHNINWEASWSKREKVPVRKEGQTTTEKN